MNDLFKGTLILGFILFVFGVMSSAMIWGPEAALWFSVGGVFALLNLLSAAYLVIRGLPFWRNQAGFLGLIFLKSLCFVGIVAAVLMFAKPLLLPFTMGIGIVIFSLLVWAVREAFRSRRPHNNSIDSTNSTNSSELAGMEP